MTNIETILENGIHVNIINHPSINTEVEVMIDVGSKNEDDQTRGMSHFLEHLLFKAPGYDSFNVEMESLGILFNASTGEKATRINFDSLDDNYQTSLKEIAFMIKNRDVEPSKFDNEKKIVIQEAVQDSADPIKKFFMQQKSNIFAGSDLEHPIIGYRDTIKTFDISAVNDFKNRYYVGENIYITVVGPNNPDIVLKHVMKHFEDIPRGQNSFIHKWRFTEGNYPTIFSQNWNALRPEEDNSAIVYSFASENTDLEHQAHIEFLSTIIGEGQGSLLFKILRDDEGLSYSQGSFCTDYKNNTVLDLVTLSTHPSNIEKYISLMRHTLEIVAEGSISKEYIEGRKNFAIGILRRGMQSPKVLANLSNQEMNDPTGINIQKYIEIIKMVKKDDIVDVAKSLLSGPTAINVTSAKGYSINYANF